MQEIRRGHGLVWSGSGKGKWRPVENKEKYRRILKYAENFLKKTLFWVVKQRVVVISCRRFGTPYWSHLKGPRTLKMGPTFRPEIIRYFMAEVRNNKKNFFDKVRNCQLLKGFNIRGSASLAKAGMQNCKKKKKIIYICTVFSAQYIRDNKLCFMFRPEWLLVPDRAFRQGEGTVGQNVADLRHFIIFITVIRIN